MAKKGKKYQAVVEKVSGIRLRELEDAVELVKTVSYSKFDGSVDLAVNLGVDPRHADQNVRGAVSLPHGLGKKVKIVVFAKGEKAVEAEQAGADHVGNDDLADKIRGGWLEFDHVVATPDMMKLLGKLGRILGPRGLMPNPKLGTVTFEVAKAITELKSGRAEFKCDKSGIIHTSVGRVSFSVADLVANIKTIIDELLRLKPAVAKATYIKRIALSPTMGPGVAVNPLPFRR